MLAAARIAVANALEEKRAASTRAQRKGEMMNAHRIETTLPENRTLTLRDVPLEAGAAIEIIVLERSEKARPTYPLRGTTAHYEAPFEPASPAEDWDVLR